MNWPVFVFIILAILTWIIFKNKQFKREEKELVKWLSSYGLTRDSKDPFDLISIFQKDEWIMNLNTIYQVIQINYRSTKIYLFSADRKTSSRYYRTYGCVLMKIPVYMSLLLFSKHTSDMDLNKIERKLKRFDYFDKKNDPEDLFNFYANDTNGAHRIVSILQPILKNLVSGELVMELRDGNLLILRDEYFKKNDVEASMMLAKNIQELVFP